jgi:hypothetical protein
MGALGEVLLRIIFKHMQQLHYLQLLLEGLPEDVRLRPAYNMQNTQKKATNWPPFLWYLMGLIQSLSCINLN